jgi:MFS family permease
VLSSFFGGFAVGAARCGRIIERVGHIRAYAAFAGLVIAATASMPLAAGPLPWAALRALVGFGCAGVFTATESWLNAKAPADGRGRVFSIYMVGTFIALAVGQLLIGRVEMQSTEPFQAIVALFAVALVMVTATRAEPPQTTSYPALPYGQLWRAAPVAVVGCLATGALSGSFYALVPAWMEGKGVERDTVGLFMFAVVTGGLAFQVPVGRLSDRLDRRLVLGALSLGFSVTAVTLVLLPRSLSVVLVPAVLLGGFLSTLYPVCVALAHDAIPSDRVVAVSGFLILVSGLGSVLGPLIGMRITASLDIDGVFYFMAAVALALAVVATGQALRRPPLPHQERTFDILAPQAAPLAHDPLSPDPSPSG